MYKSFSFLIALLACGSLSAHTEMGGNTTATETEVEDSYRYDQYDPDENYRAPASVEDEETVIDLREEEYEVDDLEDSREPASIDEAEDVDLDENNPAVEEERTGREVVEPATTPTVVVIRDQEDEKDEDKEATAVLTLAGVAVENDDNFNDRDANVGGAIFIERNFNDRFGIETGAMVVSRQYEASAGGATVIAEVRRVHVPIAARFWAGDFFSLALGPYAAFSTGDVERRLSGTGVAVSTGADESTEFGADLAATLNFAVADKTGLFAEGRYSLPFEEMSDDEIDHLSALVGLKIDM